jgi:hypothetical protein
MSFLTTARQSFRVWKYSRPPDVYVSTAGASDSPYISHRASIYTGILCHLCIVRSFVTSTHYSGTKPQWAFCEIRPPQKRVTRRSKSLMTVLELREVAGVLSLLVVKISQSTNNALTSNDSTSNTTSIFGVMSSDVPVENERCGSQHK